MVMLDAAPASTHARHESQLMVVDGAGHMGPLTHTPTVSALMMRHILDAEYRCAATTLGLRGQPGARVP